jgi:hypothetical protein
MRTFMEFSLDRTAAVGFFREIMNTPTPELLDALGLPMPDAIAHRCPSLSKGDVKDLKRAMEQMPSTASAAPSTSRRSPSTNRSSRTSSRTSTR